MWNFTKEVSAERRERLLAVPDFENVVRRIEAGAIERFFAEEYKEFACRGCTRASFTLRVRPCDYDAFFNAPVGYRAQYCLGKENGARQNRRLLEAVF